MTEQVEYNQMQFVIKPYDMLTIIFYDAHSHNHISCINYNNNMLASLSRKSI